MLEISLSSQSGLVIYEKLALDFPGLVIELNKTPTVFVILIQVVVGFEGHWHPLPRPLNPGRTWFALHRYRIDKYEEYIQILSFSIGMLNLCQVP